MMDAVRRAAQTYERQAPPCTKHMSGGGDGGVAGAAAAAAATPELDTSKLGV